MRRIAPCVSALRWRGATEKGAGTTDEFCRRRREASTAAHMRRMRHSRHNTAATTAYPPGEPKKESPSSPSRSLTEPPAVEGPLVVVAEVNEVSDTVVERVAMVEGDTVSLSVDCAVGGEGVMLVEVPVVSAALVTVDGRLTTQESARHTSGSVHRGSSSQHGLASEPHEAVGTGVVPKVVGELVGRGDGSAEGCMVGSTVGCTDGCAVGDALGWTVGLVGGSSVGWLVGLGVATGSGVGEPEANVGTGDGCVVGRTVGTTVG
mmetsp:Transcript_5487/g.17773  ORF Transcript_5487/g.17773 Transcript_5487/m.17773 type:complete len:263 (-) Transcript_5487:446-1234(-)